jgi:putative flippase GtrA
MRGFFICDKIKSMNNIVFKNKNSFLGKLENLAWKLWNYSFVRFIVVGGFNTLLGVLFTLIVRYFFDDVVMVNPKWSILGLEGDWPVTLNYLLLFPIAYTTQAIFSFRTSWSVSRLFLYPLSTIPNYLINLGFTYIFETLLGLPIAVAYALSAILPIPIMFIIIRLLVVKPSSR